MFELPELIAAINPRQTILLLGAGASIPSGAPSVDTIKRRLASRLSAVRTTYAEYSLAEITSLYERAFSRRELAESIRDQLSSLTPTGGLLLLPRFDWHRIYSTNFDRLVERVYADAHVDLLVRRSNYDFSRAGANGVLELYKIHGCISEDVGFGSKARMLLTENDYDNFDEFRQASFRAFSADLMTKDVLIIGQSLADSHLRAEVQDALKLHASSGTPGRVFVLAFERDENRAQLLEDRGAKVGFGDLNALLSGLYESTPPEEMRTTDGEAFVPSLLPAELVGTTTDAHHAAGLGRDPKRLFDGAPASYADVASGLTFRRSVHDRLISSISSDQPIADILGAGGVGKTTLARQLVSDLGHSHDAIWEHNSAFPLQSRSWIDYERKLAEAGSSAVLLVDDCTSELAQVGQLADHLGHVESPALKLILTANTGKWNVRSKSSYFYSKGQAQTISRLTNPDLAQLLNLVAAKPEIKTLVDARFLTLSRAEQLRILRERCAADMYVCMKNIFATEELDTILLREYAELSLEEQSLYRHVAALEALGAKVHRQLVLRTLLVESGRVSTLLNGLEGVITEFDISERLGLYGWATRHQLVAQTIARYKYADQSELFELFRQLVDNLNPSVWVEVETARALCAEDMGINRLTSLDAQLQLLNEIVVLLPGEGLPRHRLIRKLMDADRLSEASAQLKNAVESIGWNGVLARYDVALIIRKSQSTEGILPEDRLAMLIDAEGRARANVTRYPNDMHAFRTLGDVGVAIAQLNGSKDVLADAINIARGAESRILDPKLAEFRRHMESSLRTTY